MGADCELHQVYMPGWGTGGFKGGVGSPESHDYSLFRRLFVLIMTTRIAVVTIHMSVHPSVHTHFPAFVCRN